MIVNKIIKERRDIYGLCVNCCNPRTHYRWCRPCEVQQFRENFDKWTSENNEIDDFIQFSQLSSNSPESVFEWIPYSEFSAFKFTYGGAIVNLYDACWSSGPRVIWDTKLQQYIRSSSHPVTLMIHSQSTSTSDKLIINSTKIFYIVNNNFAPGINWYGISQDPETNALISVSECADNGPLLDYLRSNCINLNWKTRLNFLWQISKDLLCLFNSGFTYSALGTNSFVVKNGQTVALRDFLGAIDSKQSHLFTYYAPSYMSPEFFKERKITKECNIYTFGLIMYRFSAPFMQELKKNLDLSLVPESTPKPYTILMKQCLNKDPKLRHSMTQVVNKLDEFRQMSRVEFDSKLNETGAISPNDKDISAGSLLSIISNLGVDLIDIDQFTNRQYIGEGGFGSIEKALWRRTNKHVILKRIKNITAINHKEHKAFIHELKMHNQLDRIDRIHAGNILIHEGHAKITDFGISRQINTDTTIHHGIFGRIPYMEPRLLRQLDYPHDKRSDIYSFGVLMWEISSGQCPFNGLDEQTTRLNIIDGNRETPVPGTPDIYRELYVECWDDDPQKRPAIDIVLERLISMNSQYLVYENIISSSVSDEPSQISEDIPNFNDISKSYPSIPYLPMDNEG
ncbi:serine/threonine protein kinase [Gigaspora margarita]|uniref:Serine/threonine protein kinase n=1 Tax=Gigaspora margarita TaxID=4874 RepID=A0A8H4B3N7_GIGMA|nr:serine/threonine protein kinase [Gigaspora margarita]